MLERRKGLQNETGFSHIDTHHYMTGCCGMGR